MLTLGIDLASQNENTAACLVEWKDGAAVLRELFDRGSDDELVARMRAVRDAGGCVGIDAPFGWPEAFLAAMTDWREHGRFPSTASAELAYRVTDDKKYLAKKQPLSVSSDRIAYVAWRCARLLTRFYEGAPVPRLGPAVVEVYPGASMASWGLACQGYKQSEPTRKKLLLELAAKGLGFEPDEAQRATLTRSEHLFDAFVASLSARAFQVKRCDAIPEQHRDAAAREGWIMVPGASSLARLG
jgi:predicted nuclease with RNAse H fold